MPFVHSFYHLYPYTGDGGAPGDTKRHSVLVCCRGDGVDWSIGLVMPDNFVHRRVVEWMDAKSTFGRFSSLHHSSLTATLLRIEERSSFGTAEAWLEGGLIMIDCWRMPL